MPEHFRFPFYAGSLMSTTATPRICCPATYLLVQAYRHLWLAKLDDVKWSSHVLTILLNPGTYPSGADRNTHFSRTERQF